MNTTVESLKNVYVELGGSLTDTYEEIANGIQVNDYVVIPDVIDAIAQIGGSTLELPAVSASDDGDVLTVVDGKWAKAEAEKELPTVTAEDEGSTLAVVGGVWAKAQPSGSSSDLPEGIEDLTITFNYNLGNPSADKTYEQIEAYVNSGKIPKAKCISLPNLGTITVLQYMGKGFLQGYGDDMHVFSVSKLWYTDESDQYASNTLTQYYLTVDENDYVSVYEMSSVIPSN